MCLPKQGSFLPHVTESFLPYDCQSEIPLLSYSPPLTFIIINHNGVIVSLLYLRADLDLTDDKLLKARENVIEKTMTTPSTPTPGSYHHPSVRTVGLGFTKVHATHAVLTVTEIMLGHVRRFVQNAQESATLRDTASCSFLVTKGDSSRIPRPLSFRMSISLCRLSILGPWLPLLRLMRQFWPKLKLLWVGSQDGQIK